jgi:hypothetical protein
MAKPTETQIEAATEDVRKMFMSPATRRRLAKKIFSTDDQLLWQKYGLEEIYLHQVGQTPWAEIPQVLNHPVMRVAFECCLIAGLEHEEISQLLPSVYALPLSAKNIETYAKYFFDHKAMKKSDWQGYLNQIADDRYTHTRIFAALTRPQEEVLHAVGLPSRLQYGTMLKNVMNTANYRFEYYSRQQSPEAQAEARSWAKVMMDAGVRHEKFGSTDATDFSKVLQTEFAYADETIESITPEMLSDVKPAVDMVDKSLSPAVPPPPDAVNQSPDRNDL